MKWAITPPMTVSTTDQKAVMTVVAASMTSKGALASEMPSSHIVRMVSLAASNRATPPPAAVPVVSLAGTCMRSSYLMTYFTRKNEMMESSSSAIATTAAHRRP